MTDSDYEKLIQYIEMAEQLRRENAELKAENERLNNALDKERSETIKYMDELCNAKNEIERFTIDKRNAELRADVADATVEKLKAENAELKQRLESVQATAYAESVDAGMRERRLRRALYLAHAYKAKFKRWWLHLALDCEASMIRPDTKTINRIRRKIGNCEKSEHKCRAKAEEYK